MSWLRKVFGLPPKHVHDWGKFGEVNFSWSQHYDPYGDPEGSPFKIFFQNRTCNICGLQQSKRIN